MAEQSIMRGSRILKIGLVDEFQEECEKEASPHELEIAGLTSPRYFLGRPVLPMPPEGGFLWIS
jgi:hypothetical protein